MRGTVHVSLCTVCVKGAITGVAAGSLECNGDMLHNLDDNAKSGRERANLFWRVIFCSVTQRRAVQDYGWRGKQVNTAGLAGCEL